MPTIRPAGADIYYETRGIASDSPMVLIHGFGAQLILWDDGFCRQLMESGFFLILLDNRDVGLSQAYGGPEDLDGGYTLEDMAGDVIAVLDDLGISQANIVGVSMGGMIAQVLAISHPERVLGLGLLCTTPGHRPEYRVGDPPGDIFRTPQPRLDRDGYIAMALAGAQLQQSPTYEAEVAAVTDMAGHLYDRRYLPDGLPRQWAAIERAPDRSAALGSVSAPTMIFHGRADQAIHWRAAMVMAEVIEDAELHLYPGVGHEVPPRLWPEIVAALGRSARRAEAGEQT